MEIREHPLMRVLPGGEAAVIAEKARLFELGEDEVLFDDGDRAETIFLVLSGRLVLEKRGHTNEYLMLAEVTTGAYLGEMAVLDGSPRNARARSITPVRLAEVAATDLFMILEHCPPEAVMAFFMPLVRNLRDTSNRFIGEVLRKEKLAVVGEMADSIMHDLRSPLTTIQLACDLLRREIGSPKSEHYCDMADKQIRVLQDMMEELLEFSRGAPRLKRTRIPIDTFFSRFRENNELMLARTSVELFLEPVEGSLDIDVEKFLRVFQNLFNNAVEAMGHRGEIRIGARRVEGDLVVLTLRDNGPGIPEEIRDRLFEPFVTHGKERGTGVGLAIVRSMVEAHRGKVTFTSELGRGTEFQLELPLAVPRHDRVAHKHDS